MVETQVTTMVIKVVDLGCEKCHKKIKKILCNIPQIQSQIYAEKENTVTITVVCCSPERIKKKILGKGCGFIECVVIKPQSPTAEESAAAAAKSAAAAESAAGTAKSAATAAAESASAASASAGASAESASAASASAGAASASAAAAAAESASLAAATAESVASRPSTTHEVTLTIRNTCCNKCNEGSSGPCCRCHLTPQPPCRLPCRRPSCVPWEDGCRSCQIRGYFMCRCEYISEDHSSPCTPM